MKKMIFLISLFLCFSHISKAQDPSGCVTYSLPSTTISLDVEAVQEIFYAGPYAKYAEKYLGIKARMKDETSIELKKLTVNSFIEADPLYRFAVPAGKKLGTSSILKLTRVGLVTLADSKPAEASVWRFPVTVDENFSDKGLSSNLTEESTTLYRNVKKESAYNKVSVQQNMVVEKTLEQKAVETAQTILDLRRQRVQIITGDTDATFSGEAMGAAIEELARLEEEYLTLFVGYSVYQTQTMRFEVIPEKGRENQIYVAFRLSDTNGLVPADDLKGKPVVMEIVVPEMATPAMRRDAKGGELIHYRIPAVCTVKLKNGAELLLQTRIPVYQLGQQSSVPASVAIE